MKHTQVTFILLCMLFFEYFFFCSTDAIINIILNTSSFYTLMSKDNFESTRVSAISIYDPFMDDQPSIFFHSPSPFLIRSDRTSHTTSQEGEGRRSLVYPLNANGIIVK